MELYNGKINEFIDWNTGKNTFTGSNATGGLQVSGGSIRELLQSRLKEPFFMVEDPTNNKYRMFSSRDSYALWSENPTDNKDLELFNFVRPSDYSMTLTPAYSIGFEDRFIRYGDVNSTSAYIAFSWNITNDEGQSPESMRMTYTIENSQGDTFSRTIPYNKGRNPNFSIYDRLTPGDNRVTIQCTGTESGARDSRVFVISLVQISITSTFRFYEKQLPNSSMQIPYGFERNNTHGTAKIYFKIDDGGVGKEHIEDVQAEGPTKTNGIW